MRSASIVAWVAGGGIAIALAGAITGPYAISLVEAVAIAALLAASMRFVMLIGELSFASSAFVALGAYGAGTATTLLQWPFPLAILLGPLAVLVASILFGLLTLRVKGPYFMLIGFSFSEAVRIVLSRIDSIGGVSGMTGIFPPRAMDPWMSIFVVATVVALLFTLHTIENSDFGKALVSIRDNENIARTVGIDVLTFKVACFAIASVCAGIAGSLFAFVNNVVSPGDFSFLLASYALAYVKIGGEASIFGAVLGAICLSLLGSYALGFGNAEDFIYGAAIVLSMRLMPRGLFGSAGLFGRKLRGALSGLRQSRSEIGVPW